MPDWLLRFEAFTPLHLATVLGFLALWGGLCAAAQRARARGAETAWSRGLALVLLLLWVASNGVQLLPGRLVMAENLPLHPCDVSGLLVPFAIGAGWRLPRAALYFWSLSFAGQAIITPDLSQGPVFLGFWTFWLPHANLVGAVLYVLVVHGFRPTWRDCAQAYGLALLYLALVLPFDLLTGFNYGYLGPSKPATASLLDFLGPWPWRVLAIAAVAAAAFVVLQLPWQWQRRVCKPARQGD